MSNRRASISARFKEDSPNSDFFLDIFLYQIDTVAMSEIKFNLSMFGQVFVQSMEIDNNGDIDRVKIEYLLDESQSTNRDLTETVARYCSGYIKEENFVDKMEDEKKHYLKSRGEYYRDIDTIH